MLVVHARLLFSQAEQLALAAAFLRFPGPQDRLAIFNVIASSREPEGASSAKSFRDENGA
jgi:hypothetical protein